jgi:outer membrane murein-binding lipoprotein Lpp
MRIVATFFAVVLASLMLSGCGIATAQVRVQSKGATARAELEQKLGKRR